PVVVSQRTLVAVRQASAFERIKSNVGKDGPIDLDGAAQPTAGLIGKPIFEVIETHGAQCTLGEVENFVARRRTLFGSPIRLVVAIEVHFVAAVAQLFTILQLRSNVWVAGGCHESGEPIEPRNNTVFDLADWYPARPTNYARHAEATFHGRSLAA